MTILADSATYSYSQNYRFFNNTLTPAVGTLVITGYSRFLDAYINMQKHKNIHINIKKTDCTTVQSVLTLDKWVIKYSWFKCKERNKNCYTNSKRCKCNIVLLLEFRITIPRTFFTMSKTS